MLILLHKVQPFILVQAYPVGLTSARTRTGPNLGLNKLNLKHTTLDISGLPALRELLASPRRIGIISHRQPDGDAIGSSLGLYHFLVAQGHNAVVVMPTDYPRFLKWMPGTDHVLIHENDQKLAESRLAETDVLFILDFNAPSRAYLLEKFIIGYKGVKVMVDHHPEPEPCVDLMYHDTAACSTSELIYRLVTDLGHRLPGPDAGMCLYCGILTDSGSFRFPSVTAQTHRIVAGLLELGVDHSAVYEQVHSSSSEHKLRLLGYCLDDRMVVLPEFHAAYISLSLEEKERFHFEPGDTEGTVNYPLGITGIRFAAFFSEDRDRVKISFRSQGSFDVNALARAHFNGGGHRNAAGGHSTEGLETTVARFRALLPQYAAQLAIP